MFPITDKISALLLFVTNWFSITGASRSNDPLQSARLANACLAGLFELDDDDDLIPCDDAGDLGKACEDLMLYVEGRQDLSGKFYECPEWFRSQLKEGSAFMRLRPPGVLPRQDNE